MTPQEELENLNRQIADLKRQAGDMSEFIPLQNLKDAQRLFTSLKNEVSEIGDELDYVSKSFRDSVAELSKQNTELNASKSALKSISNTAQKIITTRSLEGEISSKELASLEKRAKLQFRSLEIAVKSGRLQKQNDGGAALREAENALKQEQKFFNAIKGIREEQEEINKNSGVRLFLGLEDISNAIPGLGKFTSAFKDASTAAKEQARFNKAAFGNAQGLTKEQIKQNKAANTASDQIKKQLPHLKNAKGLTRDRIKELGLEKILTDKTGKKVLSGTAAIAKANSKVLKSSLPTAKSISPFTAGLKAIGPMLKKALGPLAIFVELFQAFKAVDQRIGNIAKQLGTSYKNAAQLNSQFNSIANSSGNVMINSKGVSEAFMAISKDLGTSAALSNELLLSQTRLVEQAFYSVEAATQLTKLSLVLGENSEDITREFLGQAEALNIQNNLAVNSKQLLEASLKINKATLLTLTSQKGELAKAAFEAKKLGLELTKLDSIAEGLLNIESSISAEFEAEVISGRQLTLERARYYALTNDLAGVARELTNQGITQEYYANASRIEQVAIAQAMGMSRNEMGAMLIEQRALSKIGAKDNEAAKIKFEQLKAQYGLQYAIKNLGDEQYAQQLESASVADRFNKTMEKLREIFVGLVDPLMPVLDVFVDIMSVVGGIMKLIDPLLKTVGVIARGLVAVFDLSGGSDAALKDAMYANKLSIQENWGISTGVNVDEKRIKEKSVGDAMIPATSDVGNAIYSPTENTLFKGTKNDVAILHPKNTLSSINTPQGAESIQNPSNKTLEIKGIDKLLSALSLGMVKSAEPNTSTPILQGEKLGTESRLPIVQPAPVLRTERNQPSTVTLSAADVKAIADAVRDGAMQGTSKAKLVAEIEPKTIDRMSNSIQPYLATNTYSNSL